MNMADTNSNPDPPEECILKCENAVHFFDLPNEDILRNLWLYKLGLESSDQNFKVCNKHFSENMLCPPYTELVELAVPDQNLPETLSEKKTIYDKLIQKITNTKTPVPKGTASQKVSPPTTATNDAPAPVSTPPAPSASTPTTTTNPSSTTDWLNDSSNLLMDYQLRVKGKHMCDVIEMPEYVVVFTVFKAKDQKKVTLNDLMAARSKENQKPPLSIPPSITVSQAGPKRRRLPPPPESIQIVERNQVRDPRRRHRKETMPNVDFVYFMTDGGAPRREREVQVDINSNTRETAVQCDVELDHDIIQMSGNASQQLQVSGAVEVGRHECHLCGEILDTYASHVRHAMQHVKVRSLCPHCGIVFSNPFKLKAHEKNVHFEQELEIKKALRCPKLHCKKAFHSKRQLNNHIEDHIHSTVHKCNKCMRLFSSSLKLHCHQRGFKNCLRRRGFRNQTGSRHK